MSDEEAYAAFRAVRWAEGKPVCPHCGFDVAYEFKTRRLFKCKSCEKQFSVTSGTLFASRKLGLRDYLLAIAIFVNGVNGYAALQLSRDLNCDYKTAFVLAHKLREAMAAGRVRRRFRDFTEVRQSPPSEAHQLTGLVEVDGAVFGGHHKKQNEAKGRKDLRAISPKRKAVVTMRERRQGGRTLTFVFQSEAAAVATVAAYLHPTAALRTDEGAWWNVLRTRVKDFQKVNHTRHYSAGDGVHTNWVESFNGRLRRAEDVHRSISRNYLDRYAHEVAWREDHRRVSNGAQFSLAVRKAATLSGSDRMVGYWQRRGPRSPRRPPPHIQYAIEAAKALAARQKP